jgi:hypothetical protein
MLEVPSGRLAECCCAAPKVLSIAKNSSQEPCAPAIVKGRSSQGDLVKLNSFSTLTAQGERSALG